MEDPDAGFAAIAQRQFGLCSREQALELGFSQGVIRHRLGTRWERVLPGVYRVRGVPRSWEQAVMAACLWAGPLTVGSHATAGRIWGLDGAKGDDIEVTVARARNPSRAGIVVHRTLALPAEDRKVQAGLPVTSAARTLLDLAGVLDPGDLEVALDDALRRRLVNVPWLRRLLRRSSGRRGAESLTRLLDQHDRRGESTDSRLEIRTLRVLREAGLHPILHYDVIERDMRLGEVDFAFPAQRVAIECTGRRYHDNDARWARDQARAAALAAAHWLVIPVTWADVIHRPDEVVDHVRRALKARGVG